MAQFSFKSKSSVVIGTFNIYIVQPQSLIAMDVFERENDTPIGVAGDLTRPGLRFEVGGTEWTVRPDRLSVETRDYNIDCGTFVKKTLKKLCWTPIGAIGANAMFVAPRDAVESLDVQFPVCPGAMQRTIHTSLKVGDSTVNLQLGQTPEHLELHLNVHTDLSRLRNDPKMLNSIGTAVCGDCDQQLNEAMDKARDIFHVELNCDQVIQPL